jgi:hypothetical protein
MYDRSKGPFRLCATSCHAAEGNIGDDVRRRAQSEWTLIVFDIDTNQTLPLVDLKYLYFQF